MAYIVTRPRLAENDFVSTTYLKGTKTSGSPVQLAVLTIEPTVNDAGSFPEYGAEVLWSPDSRELIYTAQRGSVYEVRARDLTAMPEAVLFTSDKRIDLLGWENTGALIVATNREGRSATKVGSVIPDRAIVYSVARGWYANMARLSGIFLEEERAFVRIARKPLVTTEISLEDVQSSLVAIDPPAFKFRTERVLFDAFDRGRAWLPGKRGVVAINQFLSPESDRASVEESSVVTVWDGKNAGSLRYLYRTKNSLSSPMVAGSSQRILFVETGMNHTSIRSMPIAGGNATEVYRSDDYLHDLDVDNAGTIIVAARQEPTTPDELIAIDPNGSHRVLDRPNSAFDYFQFPEVSFVELVNTYGHKMGGLLVLPYGYDKRKRYPLVVVSYRAAKSFLAGGAPGDEMPIFPLASHGFVIFHLNVGKAPAPSQSGRIFNTVEAVASPVDTIEIVRAKLIKEGIVDEERCGIYGLSYGSRITVHALLTSRSFAAASISAAGYVDPSEYWTRDSAKTAILEGMGLPFPTAESLASWKPISPALSADSIRTPLLIQAPEREALWQVPLLASLERHKQPVEMLVYPSEGHVKSQPINKFWVYQRNLDWMRFWLQDYEDPVREKQEQYARWRELRKLLVARVQRQAEMDPQPPLESH